MGCERVSPRGNRAEVVPGGERVAREGDRQVQRPVQADAAPASGPRGNTRHPHIEPF